MELTSFVLTNSAIMKNSFMKLHLFFIYSKLVGSLKAIENDPAIMKNTIMGVY